ncbi:hypothetical protein TGPRC2_276930 [Toxoplasma gondii TgCatPRC2]|uniref:Immune mapped protein 2 N-terminal domain-containing protein n=15 Tax=Toxoplasma gondii TaxID=5811 RepID=B9PS42_TOXGV|nr:hypothetical protein TGME49_276930 [Toxoplasma gondii ME49]EPR63118.1 hypothetical protein TGGT1_276930 [Toxoplasma gondii GT1]ESS34674.1 hypothetical protein TGVEG_276930 [Toxoplasma gondii VEG]KAF4639030.1 hypothetical protein TGRH88_066390 [Toxoplasma gondii]KFG28006.1 hypothetical protein TGP89_276930 [Toxoplasma gondii p89]KFG33165.1 hypothetical protein TGFOU_276930 [Toxoplasma gondii FOU]KFG34192.1 hypothetical protein TGDOM2_276930 [Toxoplasma gondii GAB2-2007-GAL-DOM2]KFG56858.1 |eukprot:XP_002370441.1 hypothetical protein TGME49_276930 [Toxoplasma gondii ME49]
MGLPDCLRKPKMGRGKCGDMAVSSATHPESIDRPAVAETVSRESGGYLLFHPASNGTLFLVWSEREVDKAMAFFEPKKSVPGFKFKVNGGRQEIFRNLLNDKKNYYEGWCQFFKTAVEFNGECRLLAGADTAPLKVTVAFLYGTTVKKLTQTQTLSTSGVVAIGCVPMAQTTFDVRTMHRELFLGSARQSGAALAL